MLCPNGHEVAADANKKPRVSGGFLEADEGTRTLDLLHGKDEARADSNREAPNRLVIRLRFSRE
jgi:hypothetical protein